MFWNENLGKCGEIPQKWVPCSMGEAAINSFILILTANLGKVIA